MLLIVQPQRSDSPDVSKGKRRFQLSNFNLLVGDLVRPEDVPLNHVCMSCLARIGDAFWKDSIAVGEDILWRAEANKALEARLSACGRMQRGLECGTWN